MLFVNHHLLEGITVCDVDVFAGMIEEAYQAADPLHFVHQDEHGNDWCAGLGSTGIWEWRVVRAGKPVNGERYASPQQSIGRILLAPEKDGKRVCTVVLNGYPRHEPQRRASPGRSARQNTGTAAPGSRGRMPVKNVAGCQLVQSHLHVG